MDFEKIWYYLFDYSRNVKDPFKLNLILTYLAYRNVDINHLFLIQTVFLNATLFSTKNIKNPPLINYKLDNLYEYNARGIIEILNNHFISEYEFLIEEKKKGIIGNNYFETKKEVCVYMESKFSEHLYGIIVICF